MVLSPLLESAQEFLKESLANLTAGQLRFAIVHAITAVELSLKERITRLHPFLIYKNIDTKAPRKERTLSLSMLPQRMSNFGIPLHSTQVQLIRRIAQWRHQIVHHTGEFDPKLAQSQLAQLLDFLAGYMRSNLKTPLEDFLPKELYKDANTFLSDWQVAITAAQHKAVVEGNVLPDSCPRCGSRDVMTVKNDTDVRCHLCNGVLYLCERCDGCGRRTVIDYDPSWGENYCEDCIDAAVDQHIQQRIDLARGK